MLDLILGVALTSLAPSIVPPPGASDELDFLDDIYPIFEAYCLECHGPNMQEGGVRFDVKAGCYEGDKDFVPIVPGKPGESTVMELIVLDADDPDLMPQEAGKLREEDIEILRAWIEQGAKWEQPPLPVAAPDPLALPPLTPEQVAVRDRALVALAEAGTSPHLIAQGHEALEANLSLLGERAGDEHAALLQGLEPVLVWANFAGTGLTDAGLAKLGTFKALRKLNLSRTAITDAGLRSLEGLGQLRHLNLYGTKVTDEGLKNLRSLYRLERLYLWNTAVSEQAVRALAEARPGLVINTGAGLVVAKPRPAGPINELCPVSGKPVNVACVALLGDKQVAFCCGECKQAFEADPGKFLEALGLEPEPEPLNVCCPVSGKPVDGSVTTRYKGRLVALCCEKCKTAFDAAPETFADKLDD